MNGHRSTARLGHRLRSSWRDGLCIHRRYLSLRSPSEYAHKRQTHFIRSVAFVTAVGSATLFYQWISADSEGYRKLRADAPPRGPSLDGSSQTSSSTSSSDASKPSTSSRGGGIMTSLQESIESMQSRKKDKEQTQTLPPEKAELVFEDTQKRAQGARTKEESRDQLSSQHLQVRKSWENPGAWVWGANDGKVASPEGRESMVRNPKWMAAFDGMLLRDLKLTRGFGAAINEEGDLLQWGLAFNDMEPDEEAPISKVKKNNNNVAPAPNLSPVKTLQGKNLSSLAISRDRIIALSSTGAVYSLSTSSTEQTQGPKPLETTWGIFPSRSPISYRTIHPSTLSWNERITSIASGLDHALLLTNRGRVFTAASASESFPSKGQLGIPGLTWFTLPKDQPFDTPHEVHGLSGFKIRAVAAGDQHSVALDKQGRVFAWGDNGRGQLGIGDTSRDAIFLDAPSLLPVSKLYAGTLHRPHVRAIYAGGNTTFLSIDAERVASPQDIPDDASNETVSAHFRGLGKITADVWACGHGIWGQLGNGRWTHVQSLPTKILPLSGLFEYDEAARRAVPIRVRDISVGANHCAATFDNVTMTDVAVPYSSSSASASQSSSASSALWSSSPSTTTTTTSSTSSSSPQQAQQQPQQQQQQPPKLDTNWGSDVLFFGNNEHFQLGTGKRNNVVVPTYIRPLDRTAEVTEGKRPRGEEHRFHATPWTKVRVGDRWVGFEQRVVCGRGVSAVYSGV
ncbi:MAG: hypothetical protein M1831_006481 [Alyxoria varia]|nr:MAG: hypothetical protein M1831_006481 [Alyxoria varia]